MRSCLLVSSSGFMPERVRYVHFDSRSLKSVMVSCPSWSKATEPNLYSLKNLAVIGFNVYHPQKSVGVFKPLQSLLLCCLSRLVPRTQYGKPILNIVRPKAMVPVVSTKTRLNLRWWLHTNLPAYLFGLEPSGASIKTKRSPERSWRGE